MGKSKPTECGLGEIQFLNCERDTRTGELVQYVWASFDVTSDAQRIMNRAARDMDNVVGVSLVNKTKGVSFAVSFDNCVDPDKIKSKLAIFVERVRERFIEFEQAKPDDVERALAVYSDGTNDWQYNSR